MTPTSEAASDNKLDDASDLLRKYEAATTTAEQTQRASSNVVSPNAIFLPVTAELFSFATIFMFCSFIINSPYRFVWCIAANFRFEYCIKNRPDIDGVVTVDGDNQHKAADILKCCEKMAECKDKVVLGVRNFSGKDVPFKSRFGNNMTSFVFKFACGLNISDTQTGLRAIPRQYLELFDKVKGERFEYETNMLLEFKQSHIDFVEVPIETVYIEENASTHFNPIKDSLKIYGVIFKFLFSSIASSVIDLAMFALISALMFGKLDGSIRIFTATLGARIISSLFNYTFNRKAVFNSKSGVKSSIVRYYILCACQLCVSYGLVYLVTSVLSLGQVLTVVAKAIIDTILFVISFQIQRRWVFKHN